jgi:hypothetical protein
MSIAGQSDRSESHITTDGPSWYQAPISLILLVLLDICVFIGVVRPLRRGDGSVIFSAMPQGQVIMRMTICMPGRLGTGPSIVPMTF